MPTKGLNSTAGKSTARLKSKRKPLRDVSNSVLGMPKSSFKNKKLQEEHNNENDLVIHRLLLIRSDFSSVIQKIDELVQVLKLRGKKNGNEIESFAHVLSEMQASVKLWLPEFYKALSDLSSRPENSCEQSRTSELVPVVADDNIGDAVDSPEPSKWNSLVSPSPLVSWRAGCTPLPRQNMLSSKCLGSSKLSERFALNMHAQLDPLFDDISDAVESPEQSKWESLVSPSPLVSWRAGCTSLPHHNVLSSTFQRSSKKFEKVTSNTQVQPRPLFDITGDTEHQMLENTKTVPNIASAIAGQPPSLSNVTLEEDILHVSSEVKSIPNEGSGNDMIINEVTQKTDFISPVEHSQRESSSLMMTPCLKMSPPKSCVLLEPLSEYKCRDGHGVYRKTPYPVALPFSSNSESSSSESAEHLSKKYPELFGTKLGQKLRSRGKVGDESPSWSLSVSPPKTCVLMEPPVEKPLTNAAETGGNVEEIVESTPIMTESKSIIKLGKHPGENTLKKELWEKFEAASLDGIRFNPSVIHKATQKPFMERLDEVSCDEENAAEGV